MSIRSFRAGAALACAVVVAGLHAGAAQAAHVARLDIQPGQVAPGSQITVTGPPGWAPAPVRVTWNSLDGPVLGTFQTTTGGNASFGPGTITVPPDAAPGIYILFGNKDVPENQPAVRGVPARAQVTVVSAVGGQAPAAPPGGTPSLRTLEELQESSGASAPVLAFFGLAAFALTLGAGLLLGLRARRKVAVPEASKS